MVTKSEQVRMCGNSVCPPVGSGLVPSQEQTMPTVENQATSPCASGGHRWERVPGTGLVKCTECGEVSGK